MAEAPRDQNKVTVIMGVSSADGTTPTTIYVDPVTHRVLTSTTGSGSGLVWSEVTGTTQAMEVNNAYIANNAGLVTLTLPDSADVGDMLTVVGKGAGLWRIAQNASENINFGNVTTTTGVGGYLEATLRYDCVELVCTVANTTWTVRSSIGNITYV